MQNWRPILTFGATAAPQTDLVSKFGGLPWGLPAGDWPICRECGRPMHFLMQMTHQPPQIDLGGDDKVLFAFQCNFSSICSSWEANAGANAVFLRNRGDLGTGHTPYPKHLAPAGSLEEEHLLLLELLLARWEGFEDPLTEDHRDAIYTYDGFWDLPEELAAPHDYDHKRQTKAGGLPYWTGNGPHPDMEGRDVFLQLTGDWVDVEGVPPTPEEMREDPDLCMKWQGKLTPPIISGKQSDGLYGVTLANFCSDGTGYFFRQPGMGPDGYGLEILR